MQPASLKVRLYGDPCLRKKSLPVTEVGPSERLLIQAMLQTMCEHKGIGLAAPQVGINQRLFVADIGDGPMAFINPKIVKKKGSSVLEEGCLSIPGINMNIKRAESIIVRFIDEEGHDMELECSDLLARVILHETDHLDGKLITDYAKGAEKKEIEKQLDELQKKSSNNG